MHARRFACFLLGAWLAGSLFMAMVATQNFRSIDRLLASPVPAAKIHIQVLGHEGARALLRHQVSEQNRWYFGVWDTMQLALGGFFFLYLLFATREGKAALGLALLMLLIVVAQRLFLTPEITSVGRLLDFTPPDTESPERARFWMLHGAYSGVEVVKWIAGFVLAAKLVLRRRRRSGDAGQQFDLVDKPDHRHVNR
jgi:hypothetical protein